MNITRKFMLPALSEVECFISYVDVDSFAPFNHDESHIHTECEIYINLSGNVSFEVENRIYPVSRGSVIITRPYEYHHCICRTDEKHGHFWITFSAEENAEFLKMFFGREKGRDNLIILSEEQLQECCDLLEEMLKNETDHLTCRINFLQLLRILSNGKGENHVDVLEELPRDVTLALRYMDTHLVEEFDIGKLSAACNVSVNTLERHFKEIFHAAPFAVLRKKRLVASMEWLRNGHSVTEAALKSGFTDYSNYIQHFRKQFGLTPLQYKKKFK